MFPFFFSFFFSAPHTNTHISHPLLSLFFSTFHFQNLPLYFFLQLSPFLLFFFSFSTIIFKHTQTLIERKEKSPLLHHTATVTPPHRCYSTTHIRLYFFFLDLLLLFYFFFFPVLDLLLLLFWFYIYFFKLNQFFMRARIVLWEQELLCGKKQIKEERERSDKILIKY